MPGRRSRRPTTVSRTPLFRQRLDSVINARRKSRISADTSGVGRLQLSAEKAYSVSVPTEARVASSTIRRAVRRPARCPAVRGMPRAAAQRPFPSMMMPTWIPACAGVVGLRRFIRLPGSAFARSANQRFHVIEIPLERTAPVRGDGVLRLRHPSLERLLAQDVLSFLQLARMDAEIAVGGSQQRLEVAEAHSLVHGERAQDAEAHPLVNEPVEGHWPVGRCPATDAP